tara:strand:- start:4306 stop:5475 length:1170 start_codon:yes stop_codon:yes gene_type:complete
MARMKWENNASQHIGAKRALGEGRWDKILKRRLTDLSVADDYEDAKHEWRVTGRCWWGFGRSESEAPAWVHQTNHIGECLCGHRIVYHFEIENTENGTIECLGSDHITSYIILRGLMEETGLAESEITEAMIQEWIDVRVKSMKAESWWHEHGEQFEKTFNAVKDMDLRINVIETNKKYWDEDLKMYRKTTKIRKRSTGGQHWEPDFKMASIVWRWNHPDNPRNQKTKRGYPDKKLISDLMWFNMQLETHKETVKQEELKLEARKQIIEESSIKFKDAVKDEFKSKAEDSAFAKLCEMEGYPYFDKSFAISSWEESFIRDMRLALTDRRGLSDKQAATLLKIVNRATEPASDKQINYLRRLGYEGDFALLTKRTASVEIDELVRRNKNE